jgi:hypothetical protein
MKNFLTAIVLCVFLFILGFGFLLPSTKAEDNILLNLLNLPSPPPPNPQVDLRKTSRNPEFYSKKIPPDDTASIQDLLEYWEYQNRFDSKYTHTIKPDERTVEKLKAEIEKNPDKLASLINTLPNDTNTTDFVKRIYEKGLSGNENAGEWSEAIKSWLKYKTNTYSDQLLASSRQVSDQTGYVTNQNEILALARVDWDKAKPVLDRLLSDSSQPVSQTLARWAFYEHALATNSTGDIDKYRDELKSTVEDKSATPGMRDLAMDAIVEAGDFSGRDDWYYTLLEDESLHKLQVNGQTYTGLTTLLNHSDPEKYVAKMVELSRSSNLVIRNAAVRNLSTLVDEGNEDAIRALLPWLEDPKWAKEIEGNERSQLINGLKIRQISESVPGLLQVLNEKRVQEVRRYPNSNSASSVANKMANLAANAVRSATNRAVDAANVGAGFDGGIVENGEVYPLRSGAINALEFQKDSNAAGALRAILPEVESWERQNVVRAILRCQGFSVLEQVDALEFLAQRAVKYQQIAPASNSAATMANRAYGNYIATNVAISDGYPEQRFSPLNVQEILGMQLINWDDVSEELISATIDRVQLLEKKEPKVSFTLRQIIKGWKGSGVNSLMLRDLKSGKSDADSIVKLLSLRKEIREKQQSEIYDIRGGHPIALAVSACLLEDLTDLSTTLNSENIETRIALLACARMIRADLPVIAVAENLKNPNKLLSLAAEKYLESVDTVEARGYVLALHPGEAKILGAKSSFSDKNSIRIDSLNDLFLSVNEGLPFINYDEKNHEETETRIQKEVKENTNILGIYSFDSNFIKIYREKAVFSWEEDKSRYRERTLETEEFNNLKSFLESENINDLPPFLGTCEQYCESKQLLMVGRNGGRRIYLRAETKPKFFAELENIFKEMRQPPAKLHYWLEKYVTGLEVLYENDKLQARSVWKSGADLVMLVEDAPRRTEIDKEIARQAEMTNDADEETDRSEEYYSKLETESIKRREERQFEEFSWQKFRKDGVLEIATQPSDFELFPKKDNLPVSATSEQWKARAANFEIRANDSGVYKIARNKATLIRGEGYFQPFLSPNGTWLLTTKYSEDEVSLVRINMLTNREFKVLVPEFPTAKVVGFIPSLNKFLLLGGYYYSEHNGEDGEEEQNLSPFLLDADTGVVSKTTGNIKPLLTQTFRRLQDTGMPNESWAAVSGNNSTEVGRYDSKLLVFKPILKLPMIKFNSMDMYVDQTAGKIYFVYQGHLLSVPLPAPK